MATKNRTAKQQAGKPAVPGIALSFEDGQALATQLLHELEEHDLEHARFSLDPAERAPGQPQVNVVLQYLDALRQAGDRSMEEGFASILSDYLSGAGDGSVRDASWYDGLIDVRTAA